MAHLICKTNDILRGTVKAAGLKRVNNTLYAELDRLRMTLHRDMGTDGRIKPESAEKLAEQLAKVKIYIEMLIAENGLKSDVERLRGEYLYKLEELYIRPQIK